MENEQTIINKFFNYTEEKFIDEIESDKVKLKNSLRNIERENITKLINQLSNENADIRDKLINSIDNLIADYNIKMAYYNKKYYKQGFIDASNIADHNVLL